jgi:xylose dehydrogenase (NAD/NADP)
MPSKLRWGILGAAQIARAYVIPAIAGSANGTLTAIASRERARAATAAVEFEIPHVHASYEALLADPDVDAVYNPLPNALHAEWTIRAAQAESTCCARSHWRQPPTRRSGWRLPAASTASR